MVATRQSISRVLRHSQASPYVCRSCRDHLSQARIPLSQQRFSSTAVQPSPASTHRLLWTTQTTTNSRDHHVPTTPFVRRQFHSQPARQAPKNRKRASRTGPLRTIESDVEGVASTSQDQEYVPAETWEGLQFVGSAGDWQEMPVRPEDNFTSWLNASASVATDRAQLVSCLHQAIIECYTCLLIDLDPASTLHLDSAQLDQNAINALSAATIFPSPDRPLEVQFASRAHENAVVELLLAADSALGASGKGSTVESLASEEREDISDADVASNELQTQQIPEHSGRTGRPQYAVQDESFLNISLEMEDPITFHVFKRFTQLSGHRIPDPVLNATLSLDKPLSLFIERIDRLVLRPKPKELAETLMNKPGVGDRSNVLIFPRRETPVDKEKEIGRWKIIEKELKERGLPVLGRLKI